jgi:dihydrofolate reductase
MRKIIVLSFISLDGVMQAPGAPAEDLSGDFQYGGWMASYGDEVFNEFLAKQMQPSDLLLGRRTFEIFANYWPEHENGWPGINNVTKYVMSRTMKKSDWKNSVFLDTVTDIERLRSSSGPDIQVWGSGNLIQTLLRNDMVDELSLKIFPLTLGKGKKLFDNGPIPAAFTLTDSVITPKGVIIANYTRAGEIATGTVGS